MNVFVVAPTPMMQAGLHALLTSGGIQVLGTSSPSEGIVESLPLETDVVVIVDDSLQAEVVRSLANTHHVALIVLTSNDERTLFLLRGLDLPAWGILPLDAPAAQLQAAVLAVSQGLVSLPKNTASWVYEFKPVVEQMTLSTTDEPLTTREREVLELVSQGLSNKLIARKLQISEHTVKFHISAVSNKLGASSRTDAVRRGLQRGLITL